MSAVSVVAQLKTLASDPKNREAIVKDQGCLPGLVLFLDNCDVTVVKTALETLSLLSESSANRNIMREELGMMVSLQAIADRHDYNSRCKKIAQCLHHKLMHPLKTNNAPILRRTTRYTTPKPNKTLSKSSPCYSSTVKKYKTVTLEIHALVDKSYRQQCEDVLVKSRGVISFTFDLTRHRCVMRTRVDLKPETIATVISQCTGSSVQQIVKNDEGEEVTVSLGTDPITVDKENMKLPSYLPEDDSPMRGADKALSRTGNGKDDQGGWLFNAVSFISKSLYW